MSANHNDICCLGAFRTFGNLELYLIALIEGFKSIPCKNSCPQSSEKRPKTVSQVPSTIIAT